MQSDKEPIAKLGMVIFDSSLRLIQFFLELGIALSSEFDLDRLLEKIVNESLRLTNADGCTLYLLEDDNELHFKISKNISLGINIGGSTGEQPSFPPVPMDPAFVSSYAAINNKLVNIPDVYVSTEFDFTGPKKYDELNGYRSVSMLVTPLTNHMDKVIGVMQLLNALDPASGKIIPFSEQYEMIIKSLGSFAATAITNVRLVDEITEKAAMLKEANMDAIFSLAVAAEKKDLDTGDHVRRIQMFSEALAREIGLPDDEAEEIGYSSIMHDVGKIGIPDSILKKPGKLTAEEYDAMKSHAVYGDNILPPKPFFKMAREIARSHHEKWDGKGYPDGLKGEDIPLSARIVAVTDVFDALANRRAYKAPWTIDDTIEEVKKCAGSYFEPRLVEAWDKLYKEGELQNILDKQKK